MSSSTTASQDGNVTGTLHVAGGPAQGASNSAAGHVYAYSSASPAGTPVDSVSTAADGSFKMTLSPGTYYLAATSSSFNIDPAGATPPCRADVPVVVSPGVTSKLDVNCSAK